MRRTIALAVFASLTATTASACDFHEGFGRYEGAAFGELNADQILAMEAARAAERDRAMAEARQTFLARFDIESDTPVELAAVSDEAKAGQEPYAGRSARTETQDR